MARFRSFQCDLSRLEVAHFADENDFGSLAKCGAQRRREILRVRANLTLIDRALFVVVQKFDRIFDRHYVIGLGFVDPVDDRRKRRAFSRTGRPGQQNYAIANVGNIRKLWRQMQRIEIWYLVRDDAHHDRVRISLAENVDTKTAFARQGIAQIGSLIFCKMRGRVRIVAEQRHRDHFGLKC